MDLLDNQSIDNTQETINQKEQQGGSQREISRRDFLKLGVKTTLPLALYLAGCRPKDNIIEEEDSLLRKNVSDLNNQFVFKKDIFLNSDLSFNYTQFTEEQPNFEEYIQHVDSFSIEIEKQYAINRGIMKALSSSIICANINNWESIDNSKNLNQQRAGVMQFYPSNVLPVVNRLFKSIYSTEEANIPENNIYFGLLYLAESLKQIKNNGKNTDLMNLMLAYYYGGEPLLSIVKSNQDIDDNHYLKPNYNLYNRTVAIMYGKDTTETEIKGEFPEQTWTRILDLFPSSNFKDNKQNFKKQINKYSGTFELNSAELLTMFASVAMVESSGGVNKYNTSSKATGWYQLLPSAKHVEDYNSIHGTNYTYEQVHHNDEVSIEVGVWALMRYRDRMNLHESLKFFKAGGLFGTGAHQSEDYTWWRSVSSYSQSILGYDGLRMG